ncbi:retinoblastoma-related protein [Klebsormidium nitens]|uniref:Retinoblastoma-related protein n=1 Tax=Klebsormidium nitens TaxID=105231 RepID=A0A0U9HTG2_KLENI|nr:retinoblastoma-related protein [Klebsormidium nitens]|eukprot:GAQ86653.1 retinoblastoma-related protein [Klebsormidium nitens]
MMVSEGNPVFTPHPTPQPAPNGVRTAVNLVASPGPNMEARFARSLAQQEQRFKELCETRLFLDAETQQQAWSLFLKCEPFIAASAGVAGNSLEDTENLWRACALHTIKKLSRGLTAGFTLTQLLRASNINLVDFFNEFDYYLDHAGPRLAADFGAGVEKRLQVKELQEDFVKLTVLFGKYKKDFLELFSLEPSQGPSPAFSSPPRRGSSAAPPLSSSRPFRLGWLLFVVAKAEALPPFPDLVSYGNLLICILHVLLLHMPTPLRTAAFSDAVRFPVRGPGGVDVLGSLCATYQADRDTVQRLMAQVGAILAAHALPPARRAQNIGADDPAVDKTAGGYCCFPGLLEGGHLEGAIRALDKRYAEVLQRGGDVDERSFLDPSPAATLGTPAHLTPASKHRTLLDRPPICDPDPGPAIIARAERVLTSIFPTSAGSGADAGEGGDVLSVGSVLDGQWARVRRAESGKLYWRVLGAILAGEARVGRGGAAGALLGQDTFHRCLLALCSELVLASHKSTLMAFPAVLKPARVTAFDLIKVIEALVRAEESLPRELKRHLNSIEEKILESLAWDRGSSMYTSLYTLRKAQATPEAQAQVLEMERLHLLPGGPPPDPTPSGAPERAAREATPPANGAEPKTVEPGPRTAAAPGEPQNETGDKAEKGAEAGPGPGSQAAAAEVGFRKWTGGNGGGSGVGLMGSPQRTRGAGPGAVKRAETVIAMLTQKVLKLLAMRLRSLGERLGLKRGVGEAVYALLQHCLAAETHLFFLRHIDQLLLCAIYGVCKVCKVDVTFKDIIACYRKQPQYRPDTIRTVALKHNVPLPDAGTPPRPDTGDVIKLYNQVFVPRVKAALLRVAQETVPQPEAAPVEPAGTAAPGSPPRAPPASAPLPGSPFANLPAAAFSPKKVASGIYVSPLKGHRAGQYLAATPRSAVLVLGQSDDYQSPSQALARLSDQVNAAKPMRRLGQLNFDEGAGPAANGGGGSQKAPPLPRRPSADSGREDASGWSSGTSNGSPARPPKRHKAV